MRGILVNADERTVSEVDVQPNPNEAPEGMRELIGCDFVEAFRFADSLTMWIDDEGKLNLPKPGFKVKGCPVEFAGNGVLLADGEDGDCAGCTLDAEEVAEQIEWLAPDEVSEPEPPKVVAFETFDELMEALRKIRG